VPRLIIIARTKGISAYIGDGSNRCPTVHRLDAAHLFRLALEAAPAEARLDGVGDEGVPFRDIATVIGHRLNLPIISIARAEAGAHFGALGAIAGLDVPRSSIQALLRVLLKVTIALFVPSRLLLKSFSNIFYEKHRSFELFSYSNFLFRLWANPMLFKRNNLHLFAFLSSYFHCMDANVPLANFHSYHPYSTNGSCSSNILRRVSLNKNKIRPPTSLNHPSIREPKVRRRSDRCGTQCFHRCQPGLNQ
jgi:hypothetical protein